jgi:hypothetical protein
MTVFLVISGVVITLLLMMQLFRYRPDDMSDTGFRHFRKGLLFATLSAVILAFIIVLWTLHWDRHFDSLRSIYSLLVLAGTICNGIGTFCFLRELIQLIPGGNVIDITPEGMTLGLLMVFAQLLLLFFLYGLMFAP